MHTLESTVIMLMTIILVQTKDHCPKLKPAAGFQPSQIFGTWYAVRGIEHASQNPNSNAKQTKSCPTISITSKGDIIEFQWNSKDKPSKKLDLKPNNDHPGLLEHASKKGNSKSSLQVTNLENNKDVIGVTMCKSGGRIASVILNRKPEFIKEQIQSITAILGSQQLDVSNIYDRCLKLD